MAGDTAVAAAPVREPLLPEPGRGQAVVRTLFPICFILRYPYTGLVDFPLMNFQKIQQYLSYRYQNGPIF